MTLSLSLYRFVSFSYFNTLYSHPNFLQCSFLPSLLIARSHLLHSLSLFFSSVKHLFFFSLCFFLLLTGRTRRPLWWSLISRRPRRPSSSSPSRWCHSVELCIVCTQKVWRQKHTQLVCVNSKCILHKLHPQISLFKIYTNYFNQFLKKSKLNQFFILHTQFCSFYPLLYTSVSSAYFPHLYLATTMM